MEQANEHGARSGSAVSAERSRPLEADHQGFAAEVAHLRSRGGVLSLYLRVRGTAWRHELPALLRLARLQLPLQSRFSRRALVSISALGEAAQDAAGKLGGEGGLAVFGSLRSSAEPLVWGMRTTSPVGSYVHVDRWPRVLPLIDLLQTPTLAGVVHAGERSVDILELRAGDIAHVTRIESRRHPHADNAWIAGTVGPVVDTLATRRTWTHVLAYGAPGVADVLAEHVATATCLDVGPPDDQAGTEELRRFGMGVLGACAADRAAALFETVVRDAPRDATIGLDATARLVADRDAAALLLARDVVGAGIEEPEIERLTRDAMGAGVEVVTVRGAAGRLLAGHGGVAAVAKGPYREQLRGTRRFVRRS